MAIIQAFNIDSGIAVGDVGIVNTQGEFTGYFYGANTYNVTSNGTSSFLFNGADNPTLSLVRGFTYRFAVTSTGNPLWIKTDQSTGSVNAYANVINNGTDAGTITFPVPFNAPDTLYYKSQNYPGMTGIIYIKDVGAAGPVLRVTGTDASISNLSGALTVVGGTGIGGNLNVGGTNSAFTGNVVIGGILTANTLTVSGNITGNTINANSILGINSTITGNVTVGKTLTANTLVISGNITGNTLTVYSLNVTSGVQATNGITVQGNTSTFVGNVIIGNGNTSITSTGLKIGNTSVSGENVSIGNTSITAGNISIGSTSVTSTGLKIDNTLINSGNISIGNTSITAGNISIGNTSITAGNISIGNTSVTSREIRSNAIYAAYFFDANGNVFSSGASGASNAFTRVAVSGQSSAIANSNNATLTFSAGPGITLSTNSVSNTITISTLNGGNSSPFLIQTFTANGAQTSFVLSSVVSSTDILVTVENIPQIPNVDYTMSGARMTFDSPPDANAVIAVRTFGTATPLSNTIPIIAQTFTANGSQTAFELSGYVLATDLLVLVNNIPQRPLTNYYIDGLNLKFINAPSNGSTIDVRTFGNSYAGNGYTSITGNVYTDKIYSSSVYASKYYFYDGTPFASNPVINQSFTANGAQTTFALSNTVSASDILVSFNGIVQPTSNYSVNSGNILTFNTAVTAGYVVGVRTFTSTSPLAQNSITSIAVTGEQTIVIDSPLSLKLAAGSGIRLATNNITKTVTFSSTGGGSGSAFSWANFAVSGQQRLSADSGDATLSLISGSNINITTNPSSNSITISSSSPANGFLNFAVNGQSTLSATSNVGTLSFAAGSGMIITTNSSTNTVTFTSTTNNITSQIISTNTTSSTSNTTGALLLSGGVGIKGNVYADNIVLTGKLTVNSITKLDGTVLSFPSSNGTIISTGDTGSITNNMLSNNNITIGSTQISLGSISTTLAGFTSISSNTFIGAFDVKDSRSIVTTPETIDKGVVFDFKQNTTEGLSDGGTYFGEMTFRQYGSSTDWTGGLSHQLGFTDNGNVWQRSGSSTSWGSWKKILDSNNYAGYTTYVGTTAIGLARTSASQSLTGVSIDGSSGSVTGLTLNSSATPINPDNVTQNQLGYNTNVSLFGQTDGGLYSSAYSSNWIHQIYGDFRTGQIAIRGKNNGTWQSWRTVLDSSNYSSYISAVTKINSQGDYAASTIGTTRGSTGLNMYQVYANGYPTTYGNLLHMYGAGAGQLLIGWSGTDGADAPVYVRSKRDNDSGAWSAWREVYTAASILASTTTINDGGSSSYTVGFKELPQSTTTSGNLVLTDNGKHLYVGSGITVPPNSTVAFNIGTVITVINSSASTITITQGSGVTLRLTGTTSTGNRTVIGYGLCSMIKVATDTWYVSGSGVS